MALLCSCYSLRTQTRLDFRACGAQLEDITLSSWHTNPLQAQNEGRNHQHDVCLAVGPI